jgi:cytochrome c-type biogenesis protein
MNEITVIVAFIAGLLSFLSPCVLPLVPGFLAYLSGTTATDANNAKLKIFLNSIAFVLGLGLVFATLGVLLNTVLESISYEVQNWLARIGGTIIILFALYLLKLIKIPWLEREHKLKVKTRFSSTYITSFVFGAAFAVGWTPCVGAVLGSVLALAVTQPGTSFILLSSYALGLGIPFLIVGFFTGEAINFIKRFSNALNYFNIVVGILLLILGILVFTNMLNTIANLELLTSFIR